MSVTAQSGGAPAGPWSGADEFILSRLETADEPMTPAALAGEYGCTNGHIRNRLSELREQGEVERVAHGEYALPGATEASDVEVRADDYAESQQSPEAATEAEDADMGDGEDADPWLSEEASEAVEEGRESLAEGGGETLADGAGKGDEEGEDGAGIPVPVSPWIIIAVVVTFSVVLVVWSRRRGRSRSSVDEEEDEDPRASMGGVR